MSRTSQPPTQKTCAITNYRRFPKRLLLLAVAAACALLGAARAQAQVQDITPPTLGGYTYSPTSVDVRASGQYVNFTINATDDLSGVDFAGIVFLSPSRNQSAGGSVSFPAGATSANGP